MRNSTRSLGKLNLTHSFKAPHQQAGIAGAQDVVPEQVQLHFSISPDGLQRRNVNPSSRTFPWSHSLVEASGPFGPNSTNPFDLGPNPFVFSPQGAGNGQEVADKHLYDKLFVFA